MLNNKILEQAISILTFCLLTTVLLMPVAVHCINFVTEVVSTESIDISRDPSLDIDLSGNIHVAWTDATDYNGAGIDEDVFYKAKVAGIWTTTEVVSTESSLISTSSSLAVDSDGNVHVAWMDKTNYDGAGTDADVFYKAKIGGGWTNTEVVSTESDDDSVNPSLAVDLDGNVHVAWNDLSDYGNSDPDIDIFYKAKIGGSWTATEVVSTESTSNSQNPSLANDPDGNVHVAWDDVTDYGGSGTDKDIFYKAKVDGSWTSTEVVSTESDNLSDHPSLAVDLEGNVHLAWQDISDYGGTDFDSDIFYKAKVGGSWTNTEIVSIESDIDSELPSLASDSVGNIHVAWNEKNAFPHDIFYKAKIDGSWTLTELVSTESTSSSAYPSLAVDPDGNVHVAWRDGSDYGGPGTDPDIFYKKIVTPIALSELKEDIDAIKSEVDKIEGKLDVLLERLGIVGGLMLPTEGLKLVVDLFVNNAAAMFLGILVLIGLPLLMKRVRKKA